MFPVDSIKVCGALFEERPLKTLNRPECKFLQLPLWLSTAA
jgi:hypothetical protein